MAARKLLVACGLAFAFSAPALLAQSAKPALPRTPDGHVDLQGIWDFRSATALERPARFAGREFMTADEDQRVKLLSQVTQRSGAPRRRRSRRPRSS